MDTDGRSNSIKRSYSYESDGEGYEDSRKKHNQRMHLKMLIHTNAAGAIIGKNGETMNQIQKEADVKIKMSKFKEFFPGTQDRVCLISGSSSGLIHAFDLIFDKIESEHKPFEGHLKLLIPHIFAGLIIGKRGTTINTIMKDSHTHIDISHKERDNSSITSVERILIIKGRHEGQREALKTILKLMAEDPTGSLPYLNIRYDREDGNDRNVDRRNDRRSFNNNNNNRDSGSHNNDDSFSYKRSSGSNEFNDGRNNTRQQTQPLGANAAFLATLLTLKNQQTAMINKAMPAANILSNLMNINSNFNNNNNALALNANNNNNANNFNSFSFSNTNSSGGNLGNMLNANNALKGMFSTNNTMILISNLLNAFAQMGYDTMAVKEIETALLTLHRHNLLTILLSGVLNNFMNELQNKGVSNNNNSLTLVSGDMSGMNSPNKPTLIGTMLTLVNYAKNCQAQEMLGGSGGNVNTGVMNMQQSNNNINNNAVSNLNTSLGSRNNLMNASEDMSSNFDYSARQHLTNNNPNNSFGSSNAGNNSHRSSFSSNSYGNYR